MKQRVARFLERCGHGFDATRPPGARRDGDDGDDGDRGGTTLMHRVPSASAGALGQHTCPRCNGLMVPGGTDVLLPEVHEESRVLSWRCVNCGEWIDPTVMANRRAGLEGTAAVTRPRHR